MLKPLDDNGREIDAHFSAKICEGGFSITFESRGGSTHSNPPRNSEYENGLRLHLGRMKERGMTIIDIQVASRPVLALPEHERRIFPSGFSLPLHLPEVHDVEILRHAIGRACAEFQRPGTTGGNPTKRLTLIVQWPGAAGMDTETLQALLAASAQLYLEDPTADQEELEKRALRVSQKLKASAKAGIPKPPPGRMSPQRTSGSAERFVRDPSVVGWVLAVAGDRCEVCDEVAPFKREGGEPYLEVHHVRPLAEGGPDTVDNAVGCCPNCHRALHHASDVEERRSVLIGRVERLVNHPAISI